MCGIGDVLLAVASWKLGLPTPQEQHLLCVYCIKFTVQCICVDVLGSHIVLGKEGCQK